MLLLFVSLSLYVSQVHNYDALFTTTADVSQERSKLGLGEVTAVDLLTLLSSDN